MTSVNKRPRLNWHETQQLDKRNRHERVISPQVQRSLGEEVSMTTHAAAQAYPTLAEVEQADRAQLCAWWRFLPSPGTRALGTPEFNQVLEEEARVMERLHARFLAVGGMTPAISKALGW